MAATVAVSDGVSKTMLSAGNGPAVKKGDSITVHCTGILAESNKKFWSTKDPGQQPFTFTAGVGQAISSFHPFLSSKRGPASARKAETGWDEGCMTMRQGETSRLRVAGFKGYGAKGFPAWGITPNAELIFEIEILQIK